MAGQAGQPEHHTHTRERARIRAILSHVSHCPEGYILMFIQIDAPGQRRDSAGTGGLDKVRVK